jgi:hypothetical protein
MKKWLKRIAFVLAALVTLGALLFAEENYRGKRAWEACKTELEAKGERLDWSAFAPTPAPDEQNFTRTPLLAAWLAAAGATNTGENGSSTVTNGRPQTWWNWAANVPGGDWRAGTVADLGEWQQKLRSTDDTKPTDPDWLALRARPPGTPVEDLQFLLRQHQAELDELRAAARRPYASFTRSPANVADWLPRYALLKSLVFPFRASACAELEAGHPDAALADVFTLFALGDTASSEPLLIGGLVRIAIGELGIQPVWYGLARHRWQDAQLAQLEARLAKLNIVADLQRCWRGERAFALAALGEGGQPSESDQAVKAAGTNGTAASAPDRTMRSLPGAFRYQNLASLARTAQVLIDKFNPAGPSVRLSTNLEQEVRASLGKRTLYNSLARMLLPALSKSLEKTAYEQATVSLARVACALERHRLATGNYPEKLDALTPRFIDRLPPDPVNGEPLKYRRDAPDRFVLYSIGSNLKDDGGEVYRTEKRGLDWRQGDWVWRSEPVK